MKQDSLLQRREGEDIFQGWISFRISWSMFFWGGFTSGKSEEVKSSFCFPGNERGFDGFQLPEMFLQRMAISLRR